MKKLTICLDPGHGKDNAKPGRYDPGATAKQGRTEVTEAEIVMDWVNELRAILMAMGHRVVRTRVNAQDPAPVGARAGIAKEYKCDVFISFHCNAFNGNANGTETFYRGAKNKDLAARCNDAVVAGLGTMDRGLKTESASQHSRLAVLSFPRAVLIELGFIDHTDDRAKLLDQKLMLLACQNLADAITFET